MPTLKNYSRLAGSVFGRWTVISLQGSRKGSSLWLCRCECGNEKIISRLNLMLGRSKSCGCLMEEMKRAGAWNRTHGKSRTPAWVSWVSMLDRCENPNTPHYFRYGGRGITVCAEWHTFENFLRDMGERPEGTSIDRIDNSLGYFKSNCRWATAKEQASNRRPKSRLHTKKG